MDPAHDRTSTCPPVPSLKCFVETVLDLTQDLGLVWSGQLPFPQYQTANGRPPKRSTVIADLVDAWNAYFFHPRGVEAVLYKGRERRSGRYTGLVDMHLPELSQGDVSDPSESEDSDEEVIERRERERDRERYGERYARQEAEARRRERKLEKDEQRKRKLDKKIKRRQEESERTYTLYLQCVPPVDERGL